ncbi:hypothetical protein BDGGKGIB_01582 [Nodularia sphaerocarpa UHCC 0038]|nr:hypothetical protein BDGGKGIB_01582 [Nodularia sphaerocarpa UHCC 0038]
MPANHQGRAYLFTPTIGDNLFSGVPINPGFFDLV